MAGLVHVVIDRQRTRTLRLASGACIVGAAADCDLILDDPAVSRHHATLTLTERGVRVVDTASRNGTFYGDERIGDLEVSFGGSVRLGNTEVVFEADVADFEGTQGAKRNRYGELLGESSGMQRLFTLMERLEGSLVNVLISGESGTGKELVARALHDNSKVQAGPFVALNCGALDRSLVRSELFGHRRGSFTGASSDAPGAIETANGGTLFLDEIGELPSEIQPVLLRVLESGCYSRVGEHRERKANVRVIAATHRDLRQDVEEGLFREDLYYRLMVVRLDIPPLRSRPEDVEPLANLFAKKFETAPLPGPVLRALKDRSYRGNVRELAHAVQAYAAIGELPEPDGETVGRLESALEPFIAPDREYAEQKEALIDAFTRAYLGRLIHQTKGNRSEAARIAGLQRGYLRRLLEKYDLG